MFYSLTGSIVHMEPGMAAINVGGVAFKCACSMNTQRRLPPVGEEATLYTYLSVREDALDLYGFYSPMELNCYKLLIAISGVGPKAALAILSELTPEEVALSAAAGDAKRFTRANGIGTKLAQRIVLELKDKVKGLSFGGAEIEAAVPGGPPAAGNAAQAAEALVTLGFSPSEAAAAVARLDSQLPAEELIRLALKGFGSV